MLPDESLYETIRTEIPSKCEFIIFKHIAYHGNVITVIEAYLVLDSAARILNVQP